MMTDSIDFFVIASPKSGTTWVQKLLGTHPEIHCAESRLYGLYFDPRVGASTHLPLEQYVRFMSGYHQPAGDECSRGAYFDGLLDRLVGEIADHASSQANRSTVRSSRPTKAQRHIDQVRTRHAVRCG
ncbi:MAG: sulfotransferase [Phycisphaerales bacterium]